MNHTKRILATTTVALTLSTAANGLAFASPETEHVTEKITQQKTEVLDKKQVHEDDNSEDVGIEKGLYKSNEASDVAAKKCHDKILSVYGEPETLAKNGHLDNSIKVARNAFLEYTKTLDKIYDTDMPSKASLLADLGSLKQDAEMVNTLEQAKFGESFFDHEIIKAQHDLFPRIGKLMANESEKEMEYVILQSRKQMSAEELNQEMDFTHWDEKQWSDFEDYLKMETDGENRLGVNEPAHIPVLLGKTKGYLQALAKYYPDSHPLKLEYEIRLVKYYSKNGDAKSAVTLAEDILPKVEATFGEDSERCISLNDLLCKEYENIGQYKKAEKLLLANIAQKDSLYGNKDARTLASENDLVRLYWQLGKYSEAQPLLKQISTLAIENLPLKDTARESIMLSRCMDLADTRLHKEAIQFYQLIPDAPQNGEEKLRVLNFIINNQNWIGEALQNSLMLYLTDSVYLGDYHHQTIDEISLIAKNYIKLGYIAEADALATINFENSRAQYGLSAPCTINAMTVLAQAKRSNDDYGKALALDENVLKYNIESLGKNAPASIDALIATGDDYLGLKRYNVASRRYKEAMSLAKKISRPGHEEPWLPMSKLAEAYRLSGDNQDAIALCEEVKQNRYNFDSRIYAEDISTLQTLARAYRSIGNLGSAIQNYEQLCHSYEIIRKSALLEGKNRSNWFASVLVAYKELAETYLEAGRPALEILKVADLIKARNLADTYREDAAIYGSGLADADISKYIAYKNMLTVYDEAKSDVVSNKSLQLSLEISRLRQLLNLNTYKRDLSKKYPEYKGMRIAEPLKDINMLKKIEAIPATARFLDYTILDENKILVCVANHNKNVIAEILSVDDNFWQKCQTYRDLLMVPSIKTLDWTGRILWRLPNGDYMISTNGQSAPNGAVALGSNGLEEAKKVLATQIGDVLLKPVSKYLSASQWIISPDGELANIPFESLMINGKFALEKAEISYVPSLSVLELMHSREEQNQMLKRQKIFAMGGIPYGNHSPQECAESFANFLQNPSLLDLPRIKWQNLPGTAKEVEAVSNMFPTKMVVSGGSASESYLKSLDKNGELKNYQYILFSAHGMYIPKAPELSSIVLGRDVKADGYVTVGEWAGYNLASDLVYLSACESGLGKYQPGEGVMGIPYNLTLAGNQNTVMSLWSVDDKKTEEFTKSFFEKLSQGMPQAKALSETKQEFMMKGEKPSIWAAFLLYGV